MKSLDVGHWSRKFVYPIIFIKLYLTSDVCLGLFLDHKMQAESIVMKTVQGKFMKIILLPVTLW